MSLLTIVILGFILHCIGKSAIDNGKMKPYKNNPWGIGHSENVAEYKKLSNQGKGMDYYKNRKIM